MAVGQSSSAARAGSGKAARGLVVALDGPASSGKSSVGAAASGRLGYRFCDTGLLYRAVTWLAIHRRVGPDEVGELVRLVDEIQLLDDGTGRLAHVAVDDVDRTAEVRGPEVDAAVSSFSSVAALRTALLQRQRRLADEGRIIMAGRDIGTVVLPDADLKLFLDASVEERAARRSLERGVQPRSLAGWEILQELRRRDQLDSTRAVAPLRAADDAVVLKTDGNTFEMTVSLVVNAVRRAEAEQGLAGQPAKSEPEPSTEPEEMPLDEPLVEALSDEIVAERSETPEVEEADLVPVMEASPQSIVVEEVAPTPAAPERVAVDAVDPAVAEEPDAVTAEASARVTGDEPAEHAEPAPEPALEAAPAPELEPVAAATPEPAAQVPSPAQRPAREVAMRSTRRPMQPTPVATTLDPLVRAGSGALRLVVNAIVRFKVEGDLDAIPREGPLIVAANHASSADPVLIGAFLNESINRPINWLGKRELTEWALTGWAFRRAGIHPVDRDAADLESFRTAMRILDAGQVLAVFPEGTRSHDGALQQVREGVGMLALRSGAPVLPVAVVDSDRMWPRGRLVPKFGKRVIVRYGTAFDVGAELADRGEPVKGRAATEAATRLVMDRIAKLLPARQRGVYADAAPPTGSRKNRKKAPLRSG